MLFICLMTSDTGKIDVMGKSLSPGDFCVTGLALFGRVRRLGIMGIVTADACFYRMVEFGNDLGKTGGPRRKILMTERTISSFSRSRKNATSRIFNVFCGRTVTHLTHHIPMIGHLHSSCDIIMTIYTHQMPDILDLMRCDLVNCRSPVVSVFSEV
jgi:hypothetical protein